MQKRPTKADLRRQLERQMEHYLKKGGEITTVPNGVSGRDNPQESLPRALFDEPKTPRTPVTDVVSALDSRKKGRKSDNTRKPKRPAQKVIYDDFGEPIRKVWVEE